MSPGGPHVTGVELRRFRAGESPCFSAASRQRRSPSSSAPVGCGGRRAPFSSVAVMPREVDGASSADLADGIVEGVINGLTRLRICAFCPEPRRTDSTMPQATQSRRSYARRAAVVTGSLARSGDAVRLQVDLVDVARCSQVSSAAFDAAPSDLPKLEATRHARPRERAARHGRLHVCRGRHDPRGTSRAARNGCALEATVRHLPRHCTGARRAWSDGRGLPVARQVFRRALALAGVASPRSAVEELAHGSRVQVMRRTEHLVFMPRASSGVQAAAAEYD